MRISAQVPPKGAARPYSPPVVIYERPSRASRVLVVAFSLLVVIFAGWMLTPIMLAHYPSAVAAVPLLRDLIGQNGTPEPQPVAESMAASEPSPANEVALKAEPEPAPAFPSPPATEVWLEPSDRSPDSTHPYAPAAASTRAAADRSVALAVPPGLLPWPDADSSAAPAEPEVAEVTTGTLVEPIDAAPVPVPLPRPRPSAASLARLTVPVPRPRPDEAPSEAEESPIPDDGLFDRLTRPN